MFDKFIASAITNAVIDNVHRYGVDKIRTLKLTLDIDNNGTNDLDQATELVEKMAASLEQLAKSIDFERLGSALEKLSESITETTASINGQEAKGQIKDFTAASGQLLKLVGLALANYEKQKS